MSDSEKQAWLASLFGGATPSSDDPHSRAQTLLRTSSASSIAHAHADNGAAGEHLARSCSLGSVSQAGASTELPAPTLADQGAKSASLTVQWSWEPPPGLGLERWREDGHSLAERYAYALEWRRDGEKGQSMPLDAPPAKAQLRGLLPNTTYYVRTVATRKPPTVREAAGGDEARESGEGHGLPPLLHSAEARLLTVPEPPPLPEVASLRPTSVRLRWRPPAGGAARYSVYGSAALQFAKLASGPLAEAQVDGLQPGTAYGFRVCALNALGGASEFSAELALTTPAADEAEAAEAEEAARAEAAAEPRAGEAEGEARASGALPAPNGTAGSAAPLLPAPSVLEHGSDSLRLSWALPSLPPHQPGHQLLLECAPLDGPARAQPTRTPAGAPPSSAGSVRVGGLSPNRQYAVRLLLLGEGGAQLAAGNPLVVRTCPATPGLPTVLQHRVRPDNLAMRWAEPAGGCACYVLEMCEPEAEEAEEREWATIYEGNTAGCEISFLTPLTKYRFRLCAVGAGEEEAGGGLLGPFGAVLEVSTPLREGEEAMVGGAAERADGEEEADGGQPQGQQAEGARAPRAEAGAGGGSAEGSPPHGARRQRRSSAEGSDGAADRSRLAGGAADAASAARPSDAAAAVADASPAPAQGEGQLRQGAAGGAGQRSDRTPAAGEGAGARSGPPALGARRKSAEEAAAAAAAHNPRGAGAGAAGGGQAGRSSPRPFPSFAGRGVGAVGTGVGGADGAGGGRLGRRGSDDAAAGSAAVPPTPRQRAAQPEAARTAPGAARSSGADATARKPARGGSAERLRARNGGGGGGERTALPGESASAHSPAPARTPATARAQPAAGAATARERLSTPARVTPAAGRSGAQSARGAKEGGSRLPHSPPPHTPTNAPRAGAESARQPPPRPQPAAGRTRSASAERARPAAAAPPDAAVGSAAAAAWAQLGRSGSGGAPETPPAVPRSRRPPLPPGSRSAGGGRAGSPGAASQQSPNHAAPPNTPARTPARAPAADRSTAAEAEAADAGAGGVHAKLHLLHASRMARIAALRREREEAIVRLASPRPHSPRPREHGGGAADEAADEAAGLSASERAERNRRSAAFASRSPRSLPERARSPIVAERQRSPGPGQYEHSSQFVSGPRLRRAIVGASSAFRSTSPRLLPSSPRGSGLAHSPGPGAYEAFALKTVAAEAAARKRAAGKREPFASNSPRILSPTRREGLDTPGPGAYDPVPNPAARQRQRRTGAAFGSNSPRFDSRVRDDGPSPFYYSPRYTALSGPR